MAIVLEAERLNANRSLIVGCVWASAHKGLGVMYVAFHPTMLYLNVLVAC